MNCVNIKHPDFQKLLKESNIPSFELEIKVADWQEKNGLDKFPSVNDLLPIKPGVSELFESNPELSSIGTQEQYSQYLDTIFPDSKIKDIVYHGSEEKFDKFNKSNLPDSGIYFEKNKTTAYGYGNVLIPAVINSSGYYYGGNLNRVNSKQIRENGETGLTNGSGNIVFDPEQIHILLSKKDLEMFRNFINFTKSEYAKYGDIQQFKDYVMSKNFAAIEEFLVVNNKIDRKC